MRLGGVTLIAVLCLALTCAAACGGSQPGSAATPTPTQSAAVDRPSVGFVPEGWKLRNDQAYGLYAPGLGIMEYSNATGESGVVIYYGDVPSSLAGVEDDGQALVEQACAESYLSEECETGTMTVAGCTAGYVSGVYVGLPQMDIVFVSGCTYVHIFAGFADAAEEASAMSLIESIYF